MLMLLMQAACSTGRLAIVDLMMASASNASLVRMPLTRTIKGFMFNAVVGVTAVVGDAMVVGDAVVYAVDLWRGCGWFRFRFILHDDRDDQMLQNVVSSSSRVSMLHKERRSALLMLVQRGVDKYLRAGAQCKESMRLALSHLSTSDTRIGVRRCVKY